MTVSPDPNANWANDAIQFPRLLTELAEVVLRPEDYADVASAMDLTVPDVLALFERAQATWDAIKAATGTPPPSAPTITTRAEWCAKNRGENHVPDMRTVTVTHRGCGQACIDVRCVHCQQSGCFAILDDGDHIDW